MARKFSIITIIVLLLVLVSCRKPISVNPRVADGTIVNKYYKPPYTTTTLIPCGKVLIPMTQTQPAIYRLS